MIAASKGQRNPGRMERSGGPLLLAGAVALMLIGIVGFDRAQVAYASAARELVDSESKLADARKREQVVQQNRVLLDSANMLQQRAQSSAALPRHWGERQINLRQQNLTREEANQLLLATARPSGQLLKADEFELSVTHATEGLFDTPANANQPVLMSLRGNARFRISER